jgi:hypothetical protein
MAEWQVTTFIFTEQEPTAEQLRILNARLAQKNVPKGAEQASIHLSDYDFPGFSFKDGCGMTEKPWRNPSVPLPKFQAMLHCLGFPNRAGSYSSWNDEEDRGITLRNSSPKDLDTEEMGLLRQLFPEFKVSAAVAKKEKDFKVTAGTWKSLQHLKPRMVDVNPISRHVTCCLCGKDLAPQLLNRHWEFFEGEGAAKGELMLRVSGWSCLNGCPVKV